MTKDQAILLHLLIEKLEYVSANTPDAEQVFLIATNLHVALHTGLIGSLADAVARWGNEQNERLSRQYEQAPKGLELVTATLKTKEDLIDFLKHVRSVDELGSKLCDPDA